MAVSFSAAVRSPNNCADHTMSVHSGSRQLVSPVSSRGLSTRARRQERASRLISCRLIKVMQNLLLQAGELHACVACHWLPLPLPPAACCLRHCVLAQGRGSYNQEIGEGI